MTTILRIDPKSPAEEDIAQAVQFLKRGEVVSYPTETIYGLGADVLSRQAVKHVYELKARDYGLPISILVSDLSMLRDFVSEVSDRALALIRRFWPGPLTILFPASKRIPKGLVTNTNKVGVRNSSHPVAAALVAAFGSAVTTTSANLSGFPPSLNVKHVQKYFGEKIPCIIDGGECEPSRGSTVVDVADDTMRIIREGSIPADDVIKCFQGK
ncbi:MAG: threonylcarbamoyl-AMP synthase [Deltaproteobacteria bacterium]|nr:threonylcarbamoyl-AMP synthase [Deltaproteobacteria bacterium]